MSDITINVHTDQLLRDIMARLDALGNEQDYPRLILYGDGSGHIERDTYPRFIATWDDLDQLKKLMASQL